MPVYNIFLKVIEELEITNNTSSIKIGTDGDNLFKKKKQATILILKKKKLPAYFVYLHIINKESKEYVCLCFLVQ